MYVLIVPAFASYYIAQHTPDPFGDAEQRTTFTLVMMASWVLGFVFYFDAHLRSMYILAREQRSLANAKSRYLASTTMILALP